MTSQAVAERTETTPETQAAAPVDTKDAVTNLVTDDKAPSVQTETGEDDASPKLTEAEAHTAELEAKARETERAQIREELAEENRREAEKKAKVEKVKEQKAKQHDTYVSNARTLDALLDQIDSWQPRDPATGQLIQVNRPAFRNLLDSLNLVVAGVHAEDYRAGIDSNLDEADRETFWAAREAEDPDLDVGKTIAALIDHRVEKDAAKAKSLKGMTYEQAESAIPAVKREIAKARKEEYEAGLAGRARGEGKGEVAVEGTTVSGRNFKSLAEAKHAHAQEEISNAEFRRIVASGLK